MGGAGAGDPGVRARHRRRALTGYLGNCAAATVVGKAIAQRLLKLGVENAVFDRGGNRYHGRIKAVADGAREAGLKI